MKLIKFFIVFLFFFNLFVTKVFAETLPVQKKVYVIEYLPRLSSDQSLIDHNLVGGDHIKGATIDFVKTKLDILNNEVLVGLSNGTSYKKYLDEYTNKTNYINFSQYGETKIYYESIPASNVSPPWNSDVKRPDYIYILNRENICDLVDNNGVQDVWIWGYHWGNIEPTESNMSMGTKVSAYWNRSGYGDISNSEKSNDLPQCVNSYTVYNFSYTWIRDAYNYMKGNTVHDYMHQFENVFDFFDKKNPNTIPNDIFWSDFSGRRYGVTSNLSFGCGDTHHPPNTLIDYGYNSPERFNYQSTNCVYWWPGGYADIPQVTINCEIWSGTGCPHDNGFTYFVWWMQNVPGYQNGLVYNGVSMRNWWELLTNFDNSLLEGGGLFKTDCTTDSCNLKPNGSLDEIKVGLVAGWACDPNLVNATVQVFVDNIDNSKKLVEFTPAVLREDAVANQCGGNYKSGFSFNMKDFLSKSNLSNKSLLLDGQEHKLLFVQKDLNALSNPIIPFSNYYLDRSPVTISFPTTKELAVEVFNLTEDIDSFDFNNDSKVSLLDIIYRLGIDDRYSIKFGHKMDNTL